MLIIAYPPDEPFLHNGLVAIAQRCPKYRQLHDVLEWVFNAVIVMKLNKRRRSLAQGLA